MSNLVTVLCAVDFSAATDTTVATATRLCRAMGARLLLLHVVDKAAGGAADALLARPVGQTIEGARRKLADLGSSLRNTTDLHVEERIEMGQAASAILRVAKEEDASFLVLGRSAPKRWPYVKSLGDVLEQVTRSASVPVIACGAIGERVAKHASAVA